MALESLRAGVDIGALARAVGLGMFLTLVWAAVAWWRPESTYHLAPPLIAGAVPFLYASETKQPAGWLRLGLVAGAGLVMALVGALALASVNWLQGPTLLPFGDALVESIVFAVGGAAVGWLVPVRRLSAG